ncbi:hypothetical protein AX760_00945 [Pararhizobium antarcticum]|uniref:FecR protein domain-containing protein n=2 Tax=Pararhizobium antarcticum TaxID=1798805 RepID=A0A657M2V1_9HYPH|nr:hypothetical protein AX761_09435 [Rhizobium sp. 58]OJG01510.1 hypothetical protein AX760_00945 [Pararhizobium antarcticum]
MDWFLQLKASPNCPDIDGEFQQWIGRSPSHGRAWSHALKTWQLLGEVPPVHQQLWPAVPVAGPSPIRRRRGFRRATIAGAALCVSLLAVFAMPSVLVWWQADHRTGTGESRIVTLEDGTVVQLGGGSAIKTDVSTAGRQVTLLAGEAYFDVVHDPKRPFSVYAGGVRVLVLGTAFDVQLTGGETTVELARGRVAISYDEGARKGNFELSPGEMAVVDHASGAVARDTIAPEDIAAWRQGRMFVNDVTIADVVERLQRYHTAWISVPDPRLAARRVTGLYDLSDPDRALKALVQPYGGRVRDVTEYGRVLTQF